MIFQIRKLSYNVFGGVDEQSYACKIIENFNAEIEKAEFSILRNEIFAPQFSIPVFDSLDSEKLITAVSNLFWGTAYRLFTEVFSESSKYMTVHQAKGLEWDKVVVSVTPNRFDKIKIEDIYSNPRLINENPADEFTRMYYVACSRAREDLYIHLPDISIVDKLDESLHTFAEKTGSGIEYEIIQ